MGVLIAADPRFYQYATKRFYTGLTRQEPDRDTLNALSREFSSDGDARALGWLPDESILLLTGNSSVVFRSPDHISEAP